MIFWPRPPGRGQRATTAAISRRSGLAGRHDVRDLRHRASCSTCQTALRTSIRSLAAPNARGLLHARPSKKVRAQGMPGEGLTRGPPARKKAGGSYHRFSQIIRHSLRGGFNAYIALSLGTGLSCSHRARDHHLARLASASGGQDHTTSPSVSASLVWRYRHVHRSPHSTSVTTRPSLFDRGGLIRIQAYDSEKQK